jgi:4-hydroxy-3-methylbut-2-en-1-yl diphosphate synthase IspG/GcpE
MKITEPFLYTGMKKQNVKVEVYILDEVNDREIYVKTVEVPTEYATFKLRTDKEELRKVFDEVVYQLKEQDKVTLIGRIVNGIGLEMIGEFEQIIKGRHEIFTLKFKIKS